MMHEKFLFSTLHDILLECTPFPILYGGSVTEETIEAFITDGLVQGGLVGLASLDPKEFTKILKVAEKI